MYQDLVGNQRWASSSPWQSEPPYPLRSKWSRQKHQCGSLLTQRRLPSFWFRWQVYNFVAKTWKFPLHHPCRENISMVVKEPPSWALRRRPRSALDSGFSFHSFFRHGQAHNNLERWEKIPCKGAWLAWEICSRGGCGPSFLAHPQLQ